MADSKISALPASTTPLAGTEVLPIVQSSTTKQVSVANLTAGRTFDALGMTLTSTDAGANEAPTLDLYRDSASPTAADTLAEIQFNGKDSAGNKQKYACIHGSILSPTSTAEAGQIHFETQTAGASTEKMIIGTTNLVINEIGAVFNVRIEGDTDANLFYTDATNDRVGVGIIAPTEKLDVVGNIKLSGNVVVASGQGIDFSATAGTGSSELLDDYEEGTWTPVITYSGGNGDLSYAVQTGNYTKVGNLVNFIVALQFGETTASGYIEQISGLPFTSSTNAGGGMFIDNMTLLTGGPQWQMLASTTVIYPGVSGTGGAGVISNTNTGAASNVIKISGFYQTAS
jgi:hypothetical protein